MLRTVTTQLPTLQLIACILRVFESLHSVCAIVILVISCSCEKKMAYKIGTSFSGVYIRISWLEWMGVMECHPGDKEKEGEAFCMFKVGGKGCISA